MFEAIEEAELFDENVWYSTGLEAADMLMDI